MTQVCLSVCHLFKRYGAKRVLEDLTFEINKSDRVALYAPSGSGKTTLIQVLAGLEPFDNGSFKFAQEKPVVIFQDLRLFPFLTVEENILMPFKVQSRPISAAVMQSYRRWLEVCHLGAYAHQYPHQLSGGMKQKTALIRAFLGQPEIVLMDEPFQSIDSASKKAIMQHILETYPSTAMLLVTHQIDEIPVMAQSVLYSQFTWLKQVVKVRTEVFQNWQERLNLSADPFVIDRTEKCAA